MENVHGVIVHLSVLGTLVKIWGGRRGRVPAMVVVSKRQGCEHFPSPRPGAVFGKKPTTLPSSLPRLHIVWISSARVHSFSTM